MRRLGVVALAVLLVPLAACSRPSGGYELTAEFPSAVSLYEQGAVKVLGLEAGSVTAVDVRGDKVVVRMRIDDDVPVPEGVRAMITPQSLIGERSVQLFPAWTEGDPRIEPGATIPLARTSVPVEPDEALEALKDFLDSLDPDATGRLVRNLADDLDGNGERLNRSLAGLGDLATTLAEKDEELAALVDNFDRFTATLAARESQLGRVMDQFAMLTSLLAEEREAIQSIVRGLGSVAGDAGVLLAEHREQLDKDLDVLHRTLASVDANFESVKQLLSTAPLLVAGPELDGQKGLAGAWDPTYHHLDLRNSVSPTLTALFEAIGVPAQPLCLPIDTQCTPAPAASTTAVPPTATLGELLGSGGPVPAPPEPAPPHEGPWWRGLADAVVEALG